MNLKKIRLVQESFQKIFLIANQAMAIFYHELFEINPSLRSLFPRDIPKMALQRNKLRDMLLFVVDGLSNLDKLKPILKKLGREHVHYGVQEAHYLDVRKALLNTLEIGLQDEFTADTKQAWIEIFDSIIQLMLEGALEMEMEKKKE